MFQARLIMFLAFVSPSLSNVDDKCKHGRPITAKWWPQEPYIHQSASHGDSPRGIFADFLERVVESCCNRSSAINYTTFSPGASGLPELLSEDSYDLVLPVASGSGAFRGYPFVGVFESPGVAVLMKNNVSGAQLLLAVLEGWPILVFILLSASLAGLIIWLLEKKSNSEQFPKSFTLGVFEGFWWAFITMTTVGYGDKAPNTIVGKVLGFVWMMAGLIITTMFISIITSAMTSATLSEVSSIQGIEVSVVNQSEQHMLAIREMALVHAVPNINDLFQAMLDRTVEGALVDVHGLKHHILSLNSHNIQVATILSNHVKYGAVLGKNSSRLQMCMQSLANEQEYELFQLLAANTGGTQTTISVAEDYFGSGGIFSVTVYAGIALYILLFALGMSWEFYKKRTREKRNDSGPMQRKGTVVGNPEGQAVRDRADVAFELKPAARQSLGDSSAEQVLSKQVNEVTTMDEEFREFRKAWVTKYAAMLDRHKQQQTRPYSNQGP